MTLLDEIQTGPLADELTNQVITSGNTINFPQLEYASGQPV